MKHYDVIIIGSGLGGLECGYILSKKGYSVCILEQNSQLGGCMQIFKRGGITFDTGFHYVGGLDDGQFLNRLFRYFDLLNLPWVRMNEDAFAEVVVDDRTYMFASGYERFADTLGKDFPHQQQQLAAYTSFLKQVGTNIANSFSAEGTNLSLFQQSAYNYLQENISDPLLRKVLSGGSLTMELCKEQLPLYTFAQINSSFIQSAWRLNGGGVLITDKLVQDIRKMGGTLLTKAKVTRLIEEGEKITSVEYNNEEQVSATHVISNLHPALTLSLIPDSKLIRNIYRKRITALPNTYGMFTTHLKLKEGMIPYLNRNVFIHKGEDLWDCSYRSGAPVSSVLLSYQVPENGNGGTFTRNIDILTPMHWQEVAQWSDTAIGHRGEDYVAFKEQKIAACINIASERIPGLRNAIESVHTSTPLTYRDYTGTWQGSAFGIRKDCNSVLQTILTPQTPIPNLLLTGQNLNLHGILGVSMTSFFTCAKIVGMDELISDLT
ncbi:NAD(P)/FAD-dependent oxidoreductase [Bacteroides sp. 224]|uniref:phytoene desaturase family protein n=1 Tax=Bacteroides sp. 224 TaxID=2302936 RepID=UPI0013D37ED0|nr:NAD(P)/FAD-dependent oxidoreductase [Bacteroides sp. 224]NDV63745.1 NAD(P)/FAD-dependent oxidoreductase [Bacteroides sp. 224]